MRLPQTELSQQVAVTNPQPGRASLPAPQRGVFPFPARSQRKPALFCRTSSSRQLPRRSLDPKSALLGSPSSRWSRPADCNQTTSEKQAWGGLGASPEPQEEPVFSCQFTVPSLSDLPPSLTAESSRSCKVILSSPFYFLILPTSRLLPVPRPSIPPDWLPL